jgi:type II secretory pathway component PulM
MGTSETETRERYMVTLCALDTCTSTLYDGLTPPCVAHWMPAGSTLAPCRAGTRELATVARDVQAAGNPQYRYHTVDTQAVHGLPDARLLISPRRNMHPPAGCTSCSKTAPPIMQ